jgi:hypothetical protein
MGFWSSAHQPPRVDNSSHLRSAALRYDALIEDYKRSYELAVARGSPYADIAQRRINELYKVTRSIRGHLNDIREQNHEIRIRSAESRWRDANS